MVKKLISNSPKFVKNALTNKYVLYGVLIFSIINILGYIEANDFDALALFMGSGFLMSYFSKNMIVILLTAMFLGNCKVCVSALNGREGFKEGAGKKKKESSMSKKARSSKKVLYYVGIKDRKATCMEAKNRTGQCKQSNSGCKNCSGKAACFGCDDWGTKCGKQKKPKGCKKKSGFTQRSEPEKIDESKRENTDVDVNYGAAIETAFKTLHNMTGNNGLSTVANTTADLVDTQHKLMESITNMGPSIQSAKETLDNMKLPDMNKISELLTRMNSGGNSGIMAK
ncbi:MAG: hypothetical protein CXT73_04905 [Methanobacteriota archaeon]|nr:MAG: hypothetical protein CXT73_04905 [Euryarchaeota archaeon]